MEKTFLLQDGLNDKNVLDTIRTCEPYAVDVQSGVEFLEPALKHKKDPRRISAFVDAVKLYNRSIIDRNHNNDIDELEI